MKAVEGCIATVTVWRGKLATMPRIKRKNYNQWWKKYSYPILKEQYLHNNVKIFSYKFKIGLKY